MRPSDSSWIGRPPLTRALLLTTKTPSTVVEICRRLDGIPLAIELAAPRVNMLAPDQILNRLNDRFRILTEGARTALPRQQTLRATIDWSYHLLSVGEKALLARLSVFAGGWTMEAAREVGAATRSMTRRYSMRSPRWSTSRWCRSTSRAPNHGTRCWNPPSNTRPRSLAEGRGCLPSPPCGLPVETFRAGGSGMADDPDRAWLEPPSLNSRTCARRWSGVWPRRGSALAVTLFAFTGHIGYSSRCKENFAAG